MSTQPFQHHTPAEYLEFDRQSDEKHEYYGGEIFAMGGASRSHNRITSNIGAQLNLRFRDRTCEEYVSDMRVRVSSAGKYAYPDVMATCESPQFEDGHLDTLVNPQVIVEVLSKSTELYDRGTKFEYYRSIESLSDYVLVAQDRIAVEQFTRGREGAWLMRSYHSLTDVLELKTIDFPLLIKDIYHKVELNDGD